MLQRSTTYTIKAIFLSVVMVFSLSLFAQSEKTSGEGTVVMTKSELNSLLSTIAEARREQLKERNQRRAKTDLIELREQYNRRSPREPFGADRFGYEEISNQQILRELHYLNQRIDNLGYGNQRMLPSASRDNSTIIIPGATGQSAMYPSNQGTTATIIPSSSNKIKLLQAEIDSLKNMEAERARLSKENSFADSLTDMRGRLDKVRRQMDSLELKKSLDDKGDIPEENTEIKSYFKQQVYFDNNSETLRNDYLPYIEELIQILRKFPEAKVMLEGWASPVGRTEYNKQISMRRAEAVENVFINNRIDASRILTSFRGEDRSSSEQHARRVDMSIVVR